MTFEEAWARFSKTGFGKGDIEAARAGWQLRGIECEQSKSKPQPFCGEVSSEPRIRIYARGDRSGTEVVDGGNWKEYSWRAVCCLPPAMGKSPGVMGGATDEGPWVDAYGHSPSDALDALMHAVGRATVGTSSMSFRSTP